MMAKTVVGTAVDGCPYMSSFNPGSTRARAPRHNTYLDLLHVPAADFYCRFGCA